MIVSCQEIRFANPVGFVVLEGLNGSGKSTLSNHLSGFIAKNNKVVCKTFEPGATEVGKSLRQIVLGQTSQEKTLTPLSELLLFSADRNLHVEKIIRPALDNKEIVLCDRFFYSTLAFQGYGRGYPIDQIEMLTKLAIGDLRPDVVFLLDLDPEVGLRRTKNRQNQDPDTEDSFETEQLEFHQKLRGGFLEVAKSSPEPFIVLDANQTIEMLQLQASDVLVKLLKEINTSGN